MNEITIQSELPAAPIQFIDLKMQYAALREAVSARIQTVLDHGQFIMGPEVAELEQRLSVYTGAKHCVTVSSGTEALLIAMMALGIGPSDEVITTPFTFAATAEMIVLLGATPVLTDIETATCNIDAGQIEAKITARTKAIMPVSLYGQASDIDEINEIAARHGLAVIEDAAQSFGADYRGRKSCSLSTIGCTSFFPSKPLGCYGDGGAMFTDDDDLAKAFREIRVHGQSKRYVHSRVGIGGRMDTLQCAIVLAKLERFDWEIERRISLGARYNRLIDEAGLKRVHQRRDRNSVYAQYTVLVENRDRVQTYLQGHGIPTAVHYPVALNAQPAYAYLADGNPTPNSDWAAAHVMSLPMSADLTEEQQDRIIEALQEAVA